MAWRVQERPQRVVGCWEEPCRMCGGIWRREGDDFYRKGVMIISKPLKYSGFSFFSYENEAKWESHIWWPVRSLPSLKFCDALDLWALINESDSILKISTRNLFNCLLAVFTPESHLPSALFLGKGPQSFSFHWSFLESVTHLLCLTSTKNSLSIEFFFLGRQFNVFKCPLNVPHIRPSVWLINW